MFFWAYVLIILDCAQKSMVLSELQIITIRKQGDTMYGLLHELMELVLLVSAIAVTWAVPRPQWVSRLYTRIARFFGSQKTFN